MTTLHISCLSASCSKMLHVRNLDQIAASLTVGSENRGSKPMLQDFVVCMVPKRVAFKSWWWGETCQTQWEMTVNSDTKCPLFILSNKCQTSHILVSAGTRNGCLQGETWIGPLPYHMFKWMDQERIYGGGEGVDLPPKLQSKFFSCPLWTLPT